MSYYSEREYKQDTSPRDRWFDELYFKRWFNEMKGPILDIGCATGNFIANRPDSVEGIDIDDDSLAIAKQRGFRVRHLDVATEFHTLPDASYEGIYAKHVIEHLQDPLSFLKEVKRLLRPNGTAIISTPNCPYVLTKMFYDDYTHVRPLTKVSLAMLAHDAGIKNFDISQDFRCFPGLGRIMRATKLTPEQVRAIQAKLGIQGISLILRIRS